MDGRPAYRTGDLGRRREGLLFYEGRADDRIKVHGYRIEPGDVEASLRRLPEVADAAVALHRRREGHDALAAFVVPVCDEKPRAERKLALRSALARELPAYMLPRIVRFVEVLPLTANGKVDRQALLGLLA